MLEDLVQDFRRKDHGRVRTWRIGSLRRPFIKSTVKMGRVEEDLPIVTVTVWMLWADTHRDRGDRIPRV